MLACLAALVLLQGPGTDKRFAQVLFDKDPNISLLVSQERLDPPKFSPKKFGDDPWEFDWYVAGMGKHNESEQSALKFIVYSQERKVNGSPDLAPIVTRMLLRLWELDYRKFRFDHQPLYNNKVDVFLCYGGTPGGEQRFDVDVDRSTPPQQVKVNDIYIYDLASFTNPVEEAREVAHEYGHAVLPPVGGFATPEDWVDGQLGEKIFLRWIRDEMAAGRLLPEDVMGTSFKSLDAWVHKNVDPLVLQNAQFGPSFGLLEGQGQGPMDAFTGLVCYAESIFPDDLVGLSLRLIENNSAKSYPHALLEACRQKERVVIGIPPLLKDKDLWVPLGDGKVTGASIVKKSGDWALIHPGLIAITLRYSSQS